MREKIFHLLLVTCGLWMVIACHTNDAFVVKGIVAGADGKMLYLENVGLAAVKVMDSVKISASGQFSFRKNRPDYPDFYRLRLNNQLINIAVDSTETIIVKADAGTFATSYSVEGSLHNVAIKEITLAQLDANQQFKQLKADLSSGLIADSIYGQKLRNVINDYKTIALKYIYEQPMSTTAYFALFQTIDGQLLFDLFDRSDSRAYAAVATSLNYIYPESPRSMHVYNLTLQSMKATRNDRMLDVDVKEIDLLDIELPDITGAKVKLSDMAQGKVVILNFTAYQTEFSPGINQALQNTYQKNHAKGLEIYQVSLDTDLHIWKNVASNLPWTCVLDPLSLNSQFAALYNVQQIPALFLLDKQGIVVKRIEDLNSLDSDVLALL